MSDSTPFHRHFGLAWVDFFRGIPIEAMLAPRVSCSFGTNPQSVPPHVERDNLVGTERMEPVGLPRLVAELYFVCRIGENLYHCTHFSGRQTQFGQVFDDGNCIQQMDWNGHDALLPLKDVTGG